MRFLLKEKAIENLFNAFVTTKSAHYSWQTLSRKDKREFRKLIKNCVSPESKLNEILRVQEFERKQRRKRKLQEATLKRRIADD